MIRITITPAAYAAIAARLPSIHRCNSPAHAVRPFAVTAMLIAYVFESRSPWFAECMAVWSSRGHGRAVAVWRWRGRARRSRRHVCKLSIPPQGTPGDGPRRHHPRSRSGRLGLHAALKKAKPEKYAKPRDGLKAICRAWERASERERLDFLTALSQGDPLAAVWDRK